MIKIEYNGLSVSTPRQAHLYFRKAEKSAFQNSSSLLGAKIRKSDKPFKLEGKKVTKHLCRATKVAIIAVTIGETVEEEISRRFKDGEYTLAVLMDAAATTAVEHVADGIEQAIDQKFNMQQIFVVGDLAQDMEIGLYRHNLKCSV